MKVSRKSDYALRALMTLVGRFGKGPVSIRELAEVNDVPRRFLEHIMLELKAHGVVKSIPGRIGGFELAKRPEEITMGQIVRFFDGLIAESSYLFIPLRYSQDAVRVSVRRFIYLKRLIGLS